MAAQQTPSPAWYAETSERVLQASDRRSDRVAKLLHRLLDKPEYTLDRLEDAALCAIAVAGKETGDLFTLGTAALTDLINARRRHGTNLAIFVVGKQADGSGDAEPDEHFLVASVVDARSERPQAGLQDHFVLNELLFDAGTLFRWDAFWVPGSE